MKYFAYIQLVKFSTLLVTIKPAPTPPIILLLVLLAEPLFVVIKPVLPSLSLFHDDTGICGAGKQLRKVCTI